MARSIFELSSEQLAVVERALLEVMFKQGWIVPSGSDPAAAPLFRISVPEYMEQHYEPSVHWEACTTHFPEEEQVRILLEELHRGESYEFGLRQPARERFQQIFAELKRELDFQPTERQGVWRLELPPLDFGIERVLDVLIQFEDIRSLGGLEQAWLTLRYASAGGAQELWSTALSEPVVPEVLQRELQEAVSSLEQTPRDQKLLQILQLVQDSTGSLQKIEDTLLWTQTAGNGISVGIVDTDEIVVFAHQGEVDQWNREEEFLRQALEAPLKAATLEGLRDDLSEWLGSVEKD